MFLLMTFGDMKIRDLSTTTNRAPITEDVEFIDNLEFCAALTIDGIDQSMEIADRYRSFHVVMRKQKKTYFFFKFRGQSGFCNPQIPSI
jgi:hypothetical protein